MSQRDYGLQPRVAASATLGTSTDFFAPDAPVEPKREFVVRNRQMSVETLPTELNLTGCKAF